MCKCQPLKSLQARDPEMSSCNPTADLVEESMGDQPTGTLNQPLSTSPSITSRFSVNLFRKPQGEVSFALPRAEPARPCPYTRLAITPSRHCGPCLHLSPRAIRTDVSVVTNLKTLPTVRTNQNFPAPTATPDHPSPQLRTPLSTFGARRSGLAARARHLFFEAQLEALGLTIGDSATTSQLGHPEDIPGDAGLAGPPDNYEASPKAFSQAQAPLKKRPSPEPWRAPVKDYRAQLSSSQANAR
ncbi:hypothetical protein BGY98DRAFT_1185426 [Russula aff. rugulosa BPL654]|nr:hypothetical protein BGY98DRAFT_1185426 [Russula aff. rugulosa BPL654]